MNERPSSLRRLLLLRLWLPLLLLILAGAIASYIVARHYAEQVYDRWLWDSAMSLATLLQYSEGRAQIDIPPATVRMFEWDTVDRIYSAVDSHRGGHLFGDTSIPPAPTASTDERQPVFYDGTISGEDVRIVEIVVAQPQGSSDAVSVRVAETRRKRATLANQLLLASIPLQAIVLVLAGLLIWLGVGAGVRAANRAARRLAAHDANRFEPIDVLADSPRELWPLAHALNDLLQRLAEAQQAQQRFVANAAHQLRTPLAALQVQLERTLRETDPILQRDALGHVRDGLSRLRHLAHQILMLNRSEASPDGALVMHDVDLAALARATLENYSDRAIAEGTDLGYDGPESGAFVHGESQLLRELIGNLIDNALRYGRSRGVVTLSVSIDAGQDAHGAAGSSIVLLVDDDGPGIPEQDRGRVLERFYRRPGSAGDGCGLGLAIASEIAGRHEASLKIDRSPTHGARVSVRFPAIDQATRL
jgi:two-component system sensor histidine kinase TctE